MLRRAFPVVVTATLAVGCASARTPPPSQVHSDVGGMGGASRSSFHVSRTTASDAMLAEEWSADLAAAVKLYLTAPTAEHEIRLGQAYWRHGIADKAYEHFRRAATLDSRDGAAWEGFARIWRDWGLPGIALGHAYRAVYFAPDSAAAHNTLGTVLLALGEAAAARREFGRALELDDHVAYAQSNLCYAWLMEGDPDEAEPHCRLALNSDPGLAAACNNLALARALAGDLEQAAAMFGSVSGAAAAQYNLGVVHLSQRHYAAAAAAFDRASALEPSMTLASARARRARQLAAAEAEKEEAGERR